MGYLRAPSPPKRQYRNKSQEILPSNLPKSRLKGFLCGLTGTGLVECALNLNLSSVKDEADFRIECKDRVLTIVHVENMSKLQWVALDPSKLTKGAQNS